RREQHRCVVGETDDRQHVGHRIERKYEIGQRSHECCLHLHRGCTVEGAVIGSEQILGERQPCRHPPGLAPELPPHALNLARVAPVKGAFPPTCGLPERHHQAPSDALARRSMAWASLMSRSVTPPASCVASVTSTLL